MSRIWTVASSKSPTRMVSMLLTGVFVVATHSLNLIGRATLQNLKIKKGALDMLRLPIVIAEGK